MLGRSSSVLVCLLAAIGAGAAPGCGGRAAQAAFESSAGGSTEFGSSSEHAGAATDASLGGAASADAGSSAAGGDPSSEAGAGGAAEPSSITDSYWQFGTSQTDEALALALDESENVYVAGDTQSALDGPLFGTFDAYLRKYDAAGRVLWTRQWSKAAYNDVLALTVSARGDAYVSYTSSGPSDSPSNYLVEYDAEGELVWSQTTPLRGNALALDATDQLYLAGSANVDGTSAYLSKYDADGALEWSTTFDTPLGMIALAVDSTGGAYVVGGTSATADDPHGTTSVLAKYQLTADGTLVHSQRVTSSAALTVHSLAVDAAGNVYWAGYIDSVASSGSGWDALVQKFDAQGDLAWSRQFGSSHDDSISVVRVDAAGNVSVGGATEGALAGPAPDYYAGFVRLYDAMGDAQWTKQYSPRATSGVDALAMAASGNVYAAGFIYDAALAQHALVVKLDVH